MSRRGLLAYGHRDSISQDQWGKPRLVRSNTMPGGSYARSAIAPAPSKSRGKRVLRSVVVFFSRPKRGKMTSKSAALTEPASPVSTQLSRSSSATSSRQSGEDGGRSERRVSTRARVSFNPEVTTVTIEQMNAEEVSNTFYCRTEYAAFKEAYRTHRDTSTGWCRSNDVLPCNCDACQDDLVEGVDLMESPGGKEEEDYDSAFEDSEPERLPSSSHSIDDLEIVLHINGEDDDDDDQDNLDSQDILEIHDILDSQDILDCHDILDSQEDSQDEAPLSPGGAVFQDADDRSNGAIDDSAEEEASPVRPDLLRTRGSSWGAGGEPLPAQNTGGSHHRRGGSLDDWGGKASVQDAVRCHGPEYAYKTLRLQGFSDLYIKTHFLPEGSPIVSCR